MKFYPAKENKMKNKRDFIATYFPHIFGKSMLYD